MRTLYLDMDDVVADFKAYATQVHGVESQDDRWSQDQWVKLKENPRLYRDLEQTTIADQLVNACREFCQQHDWNLLFLSAVPRGNDVHWAFYDKIFWVHSRWPDIAVHFGPYSRDKYKHCLPGDVLIDDRTSNCQEWRSAGGIAIQHLGDLDNTLAELSKVI